MQSHPLCTTHLGQYQASSAVLGWLGDGDCCLIQSLCTVYPCGHPAQWVMFYDILCFSGVSSTGCLTSAGTVWMHCHTVEWEQMRLFPVHSISCTILFVVTHIICSTCKLYTYKCCAIAPIYIVCRHSTHSLGYVKYHCQYLSHTHLYYTHLYYIHAFTYIITYAFTYMSVLYYYYICVPI